MLNVGNPKDDRGRFDVLKDLVAGKRVLHVGCADHIQLIDDKRLRNQWLHDYLSQIAEVCAGIDINRESIEYLRNVLEMTDTHVIDITGEPSPVIYERHWDYAVLGEIFEHVDNPCSFLSKIKENYGTAIERLVITVPNALSYTNLKNSGTDKEIINSDHRYWFTPYTLAKISFEAGYTPTEFYICGEGRQDVGRGLARILKSVTRCYGRLTGRRYIRGSTIIMILELTQAHEISTPSEEG